MAMSIEYLDLAGGNETIQNTIKNLVGGVELCPLEIMEDVVTLTIHQTLPNFYRESDATAEKTPLFILVPNTALANVWPDDVKRYDMIRFGTARKGSEVITHGVVFHKGQIGVYICMSPLPPKCKLEVGFLGI